MGRHPKPSTTAEVAGRRQIPKDRPNGARAVSFTSAYSSGVRHARLIILKNTAYPWRQMIFFLALLPDRYVARRPPSRCQGDVSFPEYPLNAGWSEEAYVRSFVRARRVVWDYSIYCPDICH
jgi:hypothetical protein